MNLTIPEALHHEPTTQARDFFGHANFLVLKLTDYCNLRCKYCHQDALNGKAVLMPIETLKNAVRLILKPSVAPVVNVQFHGGEPLLQPDEFFREAVAFCREELETPTRKVHFYIQTNLTKVNEEREKMLRDLQIGISFSVDGPPKINDEMRGGGQIIFKNFKRLKEHGTDLGTICLIQPSNWDRMPEVLDYFREAGLTNVRFNLMVPDGRGEQIAKTGAEKLFNARKVIFEQMLEHGEAAVIDSTLYNQMKRFVKPIGAPSSFEYHGCESLYCQAGRSLFSINPDGAFHACDRIAERPAWTMGNVNTTFDEAAEQRARQKRSAFHHKDEWWARCEGCDAKKICEFSCSAYYVDKVDTREVECQQTKMMWEHFLERRAEILRFMAERTPPISVDSKTPLRGQGEDTWVLRDLAADTFYNELSELETIAANRHFRLVRRGDQFYLVLIERQKMFELDRLGAAIAKFNGCVPPQLIEQILASEFPAAKLQETLATMRAVVPEVFYDAERALKAQPLYHHPVPAANVAEPALAH
jgi:uncharacterized protein